MQHDRLCASRKAIRTRNLFFKQLSHDIRTQLHSVTGLAGIIAKDDLYLSKGEKKNISSQILYNTRLVSTMLDEMSIFTDTGENGHQMQDDKISPNIICQHCIDANINNAKQGVKLSMRHNENGNNFVQADSHIVELILNKLLACACIYTDKGEITIGSYRSELTHLLTFFIEDTGAGIPEERKKDMFSWFEKPDSNKILDTDTEISLSIAQHLAERIGGYIRLDDSYTKGTRMELTIPVR